MTTNRCILVVEDEEAIVIGLKYILEQAGFAIMHTGKGADALVLAEETLPALVIMDFALEDTDGWKVARQLRENPKTRHIPIIGHTGYGDRETCIAGMKAGCDEVMVKPLEVQEWLPLLSRYIDISLPK